jgi:hypothetical protein
VPFAILKCHYNEKFHIAIMEFLLYNLQIINVFQLTWSSNGMPKVFFIMSSTLSAKSAVSFSIKPDRKVAENIT